MQIIIHKVGKGEGAEEVARKYGVSKAKLLKDNNCRAEQVEEGVRLLIMLPQGEEYVVKPFDTLSGVARAFGVSEGYIAENNALSSTELFIGQKLYI